jgi:hypothetical protein
VTLTAEERATLHRLKAKDRADKRARRKVVKANRDAVRSSPDFINPRKPRLFDGPYKGFVADLPCYATLVRTGHEAFGVQVAHVRYSDAAAGRVNPGGQCKPHDFWTVPLLAHEHARQHRGKEIEYWAGLNTDPADLCHALKAAYPDREAAQAAMRELAALARAKGVRP